MEDRRFPLDSIVAHRPEPFICCTDEGTVLFMNEAWGQFCQAAFSIDFSASRNFFAQIPASLSSHWPLKDEGECRRQAKQPCWQEHTVQSLSGQNFHLRFAPIIMEAQHGWSLLVLEAVVPVTDAPEPAVVSVSGPETQSGEVMPGGTPLVLLAKEIADRKQAEESLQETKDRLTQIIHGSSIPTFVIDRNHRITHWNKALERLTCISSQEVVGTKEQWKAFYAHERPTMADLILAQAKEEKIKELYNNKYTRSKLLEDSYEVEDCFELGGKSIWLFFTAAPIKSRSGELIGAVETLQDITSRKLLEQEILRHQAILENKVEERTEQLKNTYEQLLHAEKMSAVGKLAASIAHEFGNPIIGIRNFLQGIQKTSSFDKDDAELLQLAIQECQRVKDLISNLQNFNRPTSGNMALMDLHLAINDMLLFCKKSFREKGIVVKKKFDPHLPMILAVHDQIKQVILNCLNNAQESIPIHGGTILLTTEHTESVVRLHIRDSGKGIMESDIVYIFEPFFSTKPAVEGTGLGLSVSYGIMQGHKGRIEVTDTSSHGTTFTLTFPRPQDDKGQGEGVI